jgi:outer membrane lipoprotein-sorting protein
LLSFLCSNVDLTGSQVNPSEETFRKIEEAIETAKTISVRFKCDISKKRPKMNEQESYSGVCLFKKENKFKVTASLLGSNINEEKVIVCDGSSLKEPGRYGVSLSPEILTAILKVSMARVGILAGTWLSWKVLCEGNEQPPFKKGCQVSDIKAGEDDKDEKTLMYILKVGKEVPILCEVKIWYNAKTYKLLKRSLKQKDDAGEFTYTEVYENFIFDGDIPDEMFKIQ